MPSVKQILNKAAQLLRRNWVKGSEIQLSTGKECPGYCMLGAIHAASGQYGILGEKRRFGGKFEHFMVKDSAEGLPAAGDQLAQRAYLDADQRAVALVTKVIQAQNLGGNIPNFNDKGATTLEQVLSVLETAEYKAPD